MSDYLVSKTIELDLSQSDSAPARAAIKMLQMVNSQLEQSQPRHEVVPAYEPVVSVTNLDGE